MIAFQQLHESDAVLVPEVRARILRAVWTGIRRYEAEQAERRLTPESIRKHEGAESIAEVDPDTRIVAPFYASRAAAEQGEA